MNTSISTYQEELMHAIQRLPHAKLEKIVALLFAIKERGNTVYVLGNGGSAATPSHSAGDWTHAMSVKTVCLSDNASVITAIANDNKYADVFQRQLEIFLRPGDLVIAFSGSGNSENVIKAIEYARDQEVFTIGFTGNYHDQQGGELARLAELSITVESGSMEQIEDLHLILTHVIKDLFLKKYGR